MMWAPTVEECFAQSELGFPLTNESGGPAARENEVKSKRKC